MRSLFSPELTLELVGVTGSIADLSRTQKSLNLQDYINRLQDEMKKIEAFKRELPLCVLLVSDAIARLKQELSRVEKPRDDCNWDVDKTKWMSSAQLWCTDSELRDNFGEEPLLYGEMTTSCGLNPKCSSSSATDPKLKSNPPQTVKKQRRCWSPELHRRFINALQQLGGPQAATPKQIRQLMQVPDLTNDEVKSHLQKYRIRSRRASIVQGSTKAMSMSREMDDEDDTGGSEIQNQ